MQMKIFVFYETFASHLEPDWALDSSKLPDKTQEPCATLHNSLISQDQGDALARHCMH